jgi:hypothetical protein
MSIRPLEVKSVALCPAAGVSPCGAVYVQVPSNDNSDMPFHRETTFIHTVLQYRLLWGNNTRAYQLRNRTTRCRPGTHSHRQNSESDARARGALPRPLVRRSRPACARAFANLPTQSTVTSSISNSSGRQQHRLVACPARVTRPAPSPSPSPPSAIGDPAKIRWLVASAVCTTSPALDGALARREFAEYDARGVESLRLFGATCDGDRDGAMERTTEICVHRRQQQHVWYVPLWTTLHDGDPSSRRRRMHCIGYVHEELATCSPRVLPRVR